MGAGLTPEALLERNQTVRALLMTLDLTSPGEYQHAQRVAVLATATGETLGLNLDEMRTLRYAALLHDVGKARLDQATLNKVGRLSEAELVQIRMHAEFSVRLVETVEFLQPTIPMIRHHHERWNGNGYPSGLMGQEIPLGARIIGLVEAFDVMVSGAAWQSPMGTELALEELARGSGHEWDPLVHQAFLEVQPILQPVGTD